MLLHDHIQAFQNLQNRLLEFLLIGVPGNNLGIDPLQICAFQHILCPFSYFRIVNLLW